MFQANFTVKAMKPLRTVEAGFVLPFFFFRLMGHGFDLVCLLGGDFISIV